MQWKNKGPKHNTWEPEENLDNCKDAIKSFTNGQKKVSLGSGYSGTCWIEDDDDEKEEEEEEEKEKEKEKEMTLKLIYIVVF